MRTLKLDVDRLLVESFAAADAVAAAHRLAGDSERPRDCSYFPVCPSGPPLG